MPDRMFYIEGSWLTYEQAHSLGYSLLPQRLVTFYSVSNDSVVIKQDSGDNAYYDSTNHAWVVDFADLNLYKRVSNKTFYRGESSADYRCYVASITESTPDYLFYNALIRTLSDVYENYGITSYECENIILDENNSPLVWYDSQTGKYFDDRDGFHRWVDNIDDTLVTMYDSSATLSHQIYENEAADYFYIDSRFINRSEFYSHDNYGIIRDTTFTFKDEIVYTTYYDSYSDEYCIPNVTIIWMSKDDILELGYIFVEGVADMWRCITPLHLPWKYLPSSATISFTNTSHSDLPITLPEDMEVLIGSEIILPEITGVYVDADSIRWAATRWNIGEFNSIFVLNENTVADLECEKVRVTLSFVNEYYQTLEIPLPEPITVDNGDLVTLPLVTGEYEDEEHIKWYPLRWSIGNFEESFRLREDIETYIVCEKMKVTLTFTNDSHPELDIPLPAPMLRSYGDSLILPRMRGVYRDNEDIGWIPLEWSIGSFDQLYIITSNLTTDLVWQPLAESLAVALCGSMPTNSGASTEAGVSLILSADGSFKLDEFVLAEKYLEECYEVFGDKLKIWESSYIQPVVPDFGRNSYITSEQMICGTIRKWGDRDNSYIDMSVVGTSMSKDPLTYKDLSFEEDVFEVFGDRLQIWASSYEQPIIPDFDIKTTEPANQMICGTIRKWGNYANRGIDMPLIELFAESMRKDPLAYKDLSFEEDAAEVFGDKLKIYHKNYIPPEPIVFPDKPAEEPTNQMLCGTIRLHGNKANRNIPIDIIFDDRINPNDSW